ncbi:vascular endothelial growth factor A-like [Melanaphis sacchari]|uniref:Platelet-derived growth factor subunit B n=1 Tax=Melanaphis sacchari TaxID=742174 RepID=A0A2H8TIK2_9HEMI|nr:vascular endothelial growth factor A-like [Melanaphis sacchari]
MCHTLILYLLLLVITTTTTFDKKYQFKLFKDSFNENIHNIYEHGPEQPCGGHIINSNSHKIKKFPEIPLDIIMELNQVKSVSELFQKFMPHINIHEILKYETNDGQNSTIIPKAASCTTENQTVSLRDDNNPNLYYSPPCTRVKRCGGCCGSSLVSCQPTKVEMLNFEVTILQYNETFTFKEKKIITVEQHEKCKCDCIIKEKDCKPSQRYNAKECQCICNNLDEEEECDNQGTKIWNSDTCSCQCIEEQECTTGYKFDYNTCSCELA